MRLGGGCPTKMHKTSVRIREDQREWLEENEAFNLSGAVRELLDERMPDDD